MHSEFPFNHGSIRNSIRNHALTVTLLWKYYTAFRLRLSVKIRNVNSEDFFLLLTLYNKNGKVFIKFGIIV